MSTNRIPTAAHPALHKHAGDPAVERVVLATAGGAAGLGARDWVRHRAQMHRLDLRLLTVIDADAVTVQLPHGPVLAAAEGELKSAKAYFARTAPSAEVTASVAWGDPREELGTASEAADLLVVGSNRTGALSAVAGASFSTRLVEASDCPVVVVPKTWGSGRGPVVVGIQGDDSDNAPLRLAVREAQILRRELRVAHAWEFPSLTLETGTDAAVEGPDTLLRDTVAHLRRENPGLTVRGVLLEGLPAAAALTREAAGAELLVVGSHRASVMERFFVGSVSRDVLARLVCPVAVVPPRGVEVGES